VRHAPAEGTILRQIDCGKVNSPDLPNDYGNRRAPPLSSARFSPRHGRLPWWAVSRDARMSLAVFSILLVAAMLHAGWNALVRRDPDRNAATTAIAAGGAAVALVLLPFLPRLSPAAAPYVVASGLIHLAYFVLVARAYRHGELSVAYPIMRGLAPLIVTLAAIVFVEPASARVLLGVVVVACGIVSLGVDGLRRQHAIGSALANAFVIAGYTLVDGLGARVSGAPETYVAWVLVAAGAITLGDRVLRQGRAAVAGLAARVPMALAGGAMTYAAYGIALWAMTVAPIGAVAAVRESSVLFATAIGAVMLGERFGPLRWLAAGLVVAGLVLVKSAGP
jgi:drug/metabolite transporter (DMT)-like permease